MKKTISLTAAGLLASSVLFISAAQAVGYLYYSDEHGPVNLFADNATHKSMMVSDRSMKRESPALDFGSYIYYSDEHGLADNFPAVSDNASEETIAGTERQMNDDQGDSRLVVYNSDEWGPAQVFASDSMRSVESNRSETTELTLAGTIRIENPVIYHSEERLGVESVILKNDRGELFELADNKVGNDLRDLDGRTVEIKGTVLDRAGRTTISVDDYSILK